MRHSKPVSACEDDPILDFAEVPWPPLGHTLPVRDAQHRNVAWSRDLVSGSKSNQILQDLSMPRYVILSTSRGLVLTSGMELVSNCLVGHNP